MLKIPARVRSFFAFAQGSAASKQRDRAVIPEVMGLESRIALTTFVEPSETWDHQNPALSFDSDINAEIDGSITIHNQSTSIYGHLIGQITDIDTYSINISPAQLGDFSFQFTMSGIPNYSLVDPSAYPLAGGPGGSITINAYDANGNMLIQQQDLPISLKDSTYQINTTLHPAPTPITRLGIEITAQGIYTEFVNNPVTYTAVFSGTTPTPTPTPTPHIALVSAPNPSTYGQPVTFTATVSPATSGLPTPTGTVTFMDGSTVLNPGGTQLISGFATFTTSTLAVGSHSITAVYGGDNNFSGSTSKAVTQTVNALIVAPGDISLDSASVLGTSVTYTYHTLSTGPFTVALYESADPTFDPSQDTSVTAQSLNAVGPNSSGAGTLTTFFVPNPAKPYLLVVVNPQTFVQNSTPGAPIHLLPAYLFSAAQLQAIMGARLSIATANSFIAPLNEALEEYQINTPKREAAILAQMAFESASLTRWHEKWNGNPIIYFTKKYEGKKGLGNTEPGDGYFYRGRGPLQITGRDAYTKIGAKISIDLVDSPNLVDDSANRPDIGFRASAAFWSYYKGPQLFAGNHPNTLADEVTPSTVVRINRLITKVVQGGIDGLPQRLIFYKRALKLINIFD